MNRPSLGTSHARGRLRRRRCFTACIGFGVGLWRCSLSWRAAPLKLLAAQAACSKTQNACWVPSHENKAMLQVCTCRHGAAERFHGTVISCDFALRSSLSSLSTLDESRKRQEREEIGRQRKRRRNGHETQEAKHFSSIAYTFLCSTLMRVGWALRPAKSKAETASLRWYADGRASQ